MSGGYELTYEQIMWMIPRMTFMSVVAICILLLLFSHFKSKYDINDTELNTIREKVAVCLEENRELDSCLKHNVRYIKIYYGSNSLIINKKNYDDKREGQTFDDLVLINNKIEEVKIEIV